MALPGWHAEQLWAPSLGWWWPLAHRVHDEAPAASEYVPKPHARHCAAPVDGPYVPNSQAKHVVLPVALTKWPALHALHDDEPVESVAVPAAHSVHALAREYEYSPTPQLVHEGDPAALHVPSGQSEQLGLAAVE